MPNPIALPEASTAAAPLDAEAVKRWSADPHFLESSRLWVWCRAAWPPVLLGRDAAGGQVDLQALAHAFWPWVDGLERERPYESLDALDFAHFSAGLLLYHLLQAQPGPLPGAPRSREVRASTRIALTLLAAWRSALGAPPLAPQVGDEGSASWASFLENVAEDACMAVPFLDSFTGREPLWQFPLMISERPAMRRAVQQKRAAAARA